MSCGEISRIVLSNQIDWKEFIQYQFIIYNKKKKFNQAGPEPTMVQLAVINVDHYTTMSMIIHDS